MGNYFMDKSRGFGCGQLGLYKLLPVSDPIQAKGLKLYCHELCLLFSLVENARHGFQSLVLGNRNLEGLQRVSTFGDCRM